MKDLKNLEGAKVISKMEQKVIKGGKEVCGHPDAPLCHIDMCCVGGVCVPIGTGLCEPI